jgi:predicted thioesterase
MVTRNTGDVVQAVTASTATRSTGTAVIPADNTIPQNTEYLAHSVASTALMAALFQDSGVNAIAAHLVSYGLADTIQQVTLRHTFVAGTTSATTLTVRGGAQGAGTMTINGAAGVSYMGGVMFSRITVRELSA